MFHNQTRNINNIKQPDKVRFDPHDSPHKVWKDTVGEKEHWQNFESVDYQENGYKLNLIDQHYKGTAIDDFNLSKHIISPNKGEGSERFGMRIHNSARLYKPLLKRQVQEISGRIMNKIAVMKHDGVIDEEYGVINTKPSLKGFWSQAGGVNNTYENVLSDLVSHLIAYGRYWILIHPKMELPGSVIIPPRIELVNPLEISNYGEDFVVRRKLMTEYSKNPMSKPRLYVQYFVYYPDRVEYWKLKENPHTKKKQFVLEAPQPWLDPIEPYFPDERQFTNVLNQPALPIFEATLGLDSGYAYNMASQNSCIFDASSALYYLRIEMTSPRIAYDGTNRLTGDLDSEIRDEMIDAEIADLGFLPSGQAHYIKPDSQGFVAIKDHIKELEAGFKLAYFLNVDQKAIQKSAPQSVEESKAIESFTTIVLDAVGDAETRILRSIVEFEEPGNLAQKQKVHKIYPSAYDKLSDRQEQKNKERKRRIVWRKRGGARK